MSTEPYATIHEFKPDNKSGLLDIDGEPMLGWYFQLMANTEQALTELIGPYLSGEECEKAALAEWATLQ